MHKEYIQSSIDQALQGNSWLCNALLKQEFNPDHLMFASGIRVSNTSAKREIKHGDVINVVEFEYKGEFVYVRFVGYDSSYESDTYEEYSFVEPVTRTVVDFE